ncbi:MAG: hypothetical protein WD599_04460, partial [Balneolaceae bacterium]
MRQKLNPLKNTVRLGFTKTSVILFLLFLLMPGVSCQQEKESNPYQTWNTYKGDPTASSYSELDQIHRGNVDQLDVAWIYNSGDQRPAGSQSNPIMIDGVVYIT